MSCGGFSACFSLAVRDLFVTFRQIRLSLTYTHHMYLATSSMPSTGAERNAVSAAHARAAFKALYLVSGAAAQLGAYGLRIEDSQWHALAQAARDANNALLAHDHIESETIAAFRRLSALCEHLLEHRARGHACPSAVWRDLARAGRDAYEQLDT